MEQELKDLIKKLTLVEDANTYVLIAGNAKGEVGSSKDGNVFVHIGFLEVLKQKLIDNMGVAPKEEPKAADAPQ